MCLKAEAGLKKRFPASLESRTETVGGTDVIWGRGWDRMEPRLAHFQHRGILTVLSASCCSLTTSSHWEWQPCQTQNFWATQWFLKAEAVSSQAVVSLGGNCIKMTPYWLTGGLVEGEFLSPYKLCTVKYIIYFLQKSISPPEYVPHRPGKKFKLQPIAAVPLFSTLRICFCLFRIFFGWRIEKHT